MGSRGLSTLKRFSHDVVRRFNQSDPQPAGPNKGGSGALDRSGHVGDF
ncbi:hypothetical protein HanXRQr2_Chr14g0620801 [Helianthus annuus]|uniref:Uncharacterized protein n=1 Tax=Helianthus annuus TaxID=4232 RepID=A0A9K3E5G3_HELAN|nr:hypothetical protein HanXRQr2_Chr14g0620801 [Helianthus annuus]